MTRTASPTAGTRRDSWLWLPRRAIAALFLLWLLTRWIFGSVHNLVPDEAYYWTWSRHLAAGYLDHPPMVAFLIRVGTMIFGPTELGVRIPAGVLTALAVLILTLATGKVIAGNFKAASFVPLALLCSPMVAVIGSIVTPDAPACFFQSAALAVALLIFDPNKPVGRGPLWLAFGILIGLALDSKYTSGLLGAAVFLALLFSNDGRRHLLTPWPWLGAVLAAAVFWPVVNWNVHHDWASFRFQLHHGMASDHSPFKNLLDYIGGQLGVCTPVLFILCLAVLFIFARRKNNPAYIQILLFSSALPLLFFAYSSTRHHVEANWPVFAYFPAVILVAVYLAENWGPRRVAWAELAIIVAFIGTLIIHAPELVWKITPKLGTPQWDHLFEWRQLAVNEVAPQMLESPVFAADYEYAAELSFYLPDQPDIWPLSDPARPTAFDFFPDVPGPQSFQRIVLVRRLPKGFDAPAAWQPLGPNWKYVVVGDPSQFKEGRQIRRSLIEIATR